MKGELPADWDAKVRRRLAEIAAKAENIATRKASQNAIGAWSRRCPELVGGSADLAGSNLTLWKGSKGVTKDRRRQLPVLRRARVRHDRDHANGIVAARRLIPYTATFLVFSDYARNAIRMAALMKQRQIYGLYARLHRPRRGRPDAPAGRADRQPAHDPEHGRLASADATETFVAWAAAVERKTARACSPVAPEPADQITCRARSDQPTSAKGGYVLADAPVRSRADRHRFGSRSWP
jgi:transketolase